MKREIFLLADRGSESTAFPLFQLPNGVRLSGYQGSSDDQQGGKMFSTNQSICLRFRSQPIRLRKIALAKRKPANLWLSGKRGHGKRGHGKRGHGERGHGKRGHGKRGHGKRGHGKHGCGKRGH